MFGTISLLKLRSQVPVPLPLLPSPTPPATRFSSFPLPSPSPSPPGRETARPTARATLPPPASLLDCLAKDTAFHSPSLFGKPLKNQVGLVKVDSWSNRAGFRRSTTAPRIGSRTTLRRGRQCAQCFPKFLIASPSFHGGRGALPSAGGHPSDLTYLAGGGAAEA